MPLANDVSCSGAFFWCDKSQAPVRGFSHEDHALTFNAAHGTRSEVDQYRYAPPNDLLGLEMFGNPAQYSALIQSCSNGQVEQLIRFRDPFACDYFADP